MDATKFKRAIGIAGLLLMTILVVWGVVYVQRAGLIPSSSTAESAAQTTDAQEVSQEPMRTDGGQSTTEWLPEIEYDDYTPSEIEQSNFRSTVILGNSQAQALHNFGLVKNADFVTKVGLSINRVLTDPDGDAPIEKLRGKTYRKAVFVFGENELGWPAPANFIKIYKQVIARVREMNPGVQVFVQAIFPVTNEASEKSKIGVTNAHVRLFNTALEAMCSEIGATFMPVSDAFFDRSGALPEGVAHDGVHFGYDLCKVWAGDMSAYIGEDLMPETTQLTTAPTTSATEPVIAATIPVQPTSAMEEYSDAELSDVEENT